MVSRLACCFPFCERTLREAFQEEITVIVDRTDGRPLGLRLEDDYDSLTVRGIDAGLISKWNAANPKRCVKIGDWLVEASGAKGDVDDILDACEKKTGLVLTFQRRGWYLRVYPKLFGIGMAIILALFARWLVTRPRCPPLVVCEAGINCTVDSWQLRSQFWTELLADVNETGLPLWSWFEHKRRAGYKPAIVHVGPMDLSAPSDIKLYHLVKQFEPYGVFVEPNPPMVKALRKALEPLGFKKGHSTVIRSAACTTDEPHVPLYRMAPAFFKAHPQFGPVPFSMFSSLNRSYVEVSFLNTFPSVWSTYQEPEWKALGKEYIEALPVRCVSPLTILREARLPPSSVDALVIDAEGVDVELVGMFLQLPKFAPAWIQFEWIDQFKSKADLLGQIVRDLSKRGYKVYQDGSDLIAVLVQYTDDAAAEDAAEDVADVPGSADVADTDL
eukprot:CAMPEP_0197902588 /NCGR_PEP_ID=MMETSP1439-20131203/53833_1 /TAXON_ID=66791 /ORGANISM="Gonyaulax spinifera, Strain CCMP409" /LENGTH=443 /DNA_ID=CAMNT_0043523633 /DNA_START=69 /DNA_END=1400 /DNA_ORIENTATION=+